MKLSVVMPVLDEADALPAAMSALRRVDGVHEIVVADGGSGDGTAALAATLADRVTVSAPGRARQSDAGAAAATGDAILFLHADTRLPEDTGRLVAEALAPPGRVWGRFDVRIAGRSRCLPLVAGMMNRRSRWTGVATGDQAIFVDRATLHRIGGVPQIAIMEDIALSKALRRIAAPVCLRAQVVTSGRRWDANGAVRTIATMWALRLGYVAGVPPARLAQVYGALRRG